jgi:hypothetical protein
MLIVYCRSSIVSRRLSTGTRYKIGLVEDWTSKVHACRNNAETEREAARKKPVATEADEPSPSLLAPAELAWVPYSTKPTLGLLARA